jgi:hypothetical protein
LVDFSDHFGRLKSFDKPIPATQGASKNRADVLAKADELKQHEKGSISLINGKITKRRLYWAFGNSVRKYWYLIEEDTISGIKKRSKRYFSREGALWAHQEDCITWVQTFR